MFLFFIVDMDKANQTSIYYTIEHDMRHSKEYLANMKFNYIEVLHKSIFLKRLRGQREEDPIQRKKEELVETKKRIEEMRKKFERISHEISVLREQSKEQEATLRERKEKETILKKRIEEISNTKETIKKFTEIKKDHEAREIRIREIKEKIEKEENRLKVERKELETKQLVKDSLLVQKDSLQDRLKTLHKTSNQQLVYQYNWYKLFLNVFYKLARIRVIDVRQSTHRHQGTIYTSTEDKEKKKKESIDEIAVKLLSKKGERTVVITLSFVDGKLDGYNIHRTEGTSQIEPVSCDKLFQYCKKVNSVRYFIFESIDSQLRKG